MLWITFLLSILLIGSLWKSEISRTIVLLIYQPNLKVALDLVIFHLPEKYRENILKLSSKYIQSNTFYVTYGGPILK